MPQENHAVLRLRDVAKSFGGTPVLFISSFEVRKGEQVALAGPSGSGKTTFLNLVAGIADADRGEILVDGLDMTRLGGRSRDLHRGRAIGIVFQTFNLLQGFSALDNLRLALMFGSVPREEHDRSARDLMARMGLSEVMHRKPSELSVGQQQRVAIARALVNRPALVLADEPASQLDPDNAEKAITLLQEASREGGHALVVVAHDALVLGKFSRVVHIREFKP